MSRCLIRSSCAVITIFWALIASIPAYSISGGYNEAKNFFQSEMNVRQRLRLQEWLIAAGFSNFVPNEDLNLRTFEAIKRFQKANGFEADGIVSPDQLQKLEELAAPWFNLWGFRIVKHPYRPVKIWIPLGLGLQPKRDYFGVTYADPQNRLSINFTTTPNFSIGRAFAALVNHFVKNHAIVHYKILKDGWFVISASTPDRVDWYLRYHQDGSYVTGFTEQWNNANGNVHGERIAVLMSASLWSYMTGVAFVQPPSISIGTSAQITPPSTPPTQAREPVTASDPLAGHAPWGPPPQAREPVTSPSPPSTEVKISTGTGFFVTGAGDFVTNAHVVENCTKTLVKTNDGTVQEAREAASDPINDLALLKVPKTPKKFASLRLGIRLGESVAAFGFPHSDILSTSGNFTLGNVTATNGIKDDSRYIQISAPVQAGNSGGPLLDQNGALVGVVSEKLNALKIALQDGDLPQNVNFAIKATILAAFLESNQIAFKTATPATQPLEPADLADVAQSISGFVMCR